MLRHEKFRYEHALLFNEKIWLFTILIGSFTLEELTKMSLGKKQGLKETPSTK